MTKTSRDDSPIRLNEEFILISLQETPELAKIEHGVYTGRVVIHGCLMGVYIGPLMAPANPELLTTLYKKVGKRYLKL